MAGPGAGFAAVLGSPIDHSLSPTLHRAAYRALGLTGWRYEAIECDVAGLPDLLAGSSELTVGYSCTMPLKRRALELAGDASSQARAIGAANTLLPCPGGWYADNTDWIGIRDALAERGIDLAGTAVLVVGAGGTAQAALAALGEAGSVTVLVRDRATARPLLETADQLGRTVELADLAEFSGSAARVVISTVPAGAADRLAGLSWRADQALLDVVYDPWPTKLAAAFGTAGATVVGGADMLLFQAARQVELMTGRAAPVPAMRAALAAARARHR
jgi:shikimate dehydrogenase